MHLDQHRSSPRLDAKHATLTEEVFKQTEGHCEILKKVKINSKLIFKGSIRWGPKNCIREAENIKTGQFFKRIDNTVLRYPIWHFDALEGQKIKIRQETYMKIQKQMWVLPSPSHFYSHLMTFYTPWNKNFTKCSNTKHYLLLFPLLFRFKKKNTKFVVIQN